MSWAPFEPATENGARTLIRRKQVIDLPEYLSNKNEIKAYLHCGICLREMPVGVSPKEYQRIQAGWTKYGLQIWCLRHDVNIVHIDFEGAKHPANNTADIKHLKKEL